jgi:type 1 glutamine amidotransferase
MRCLAWMVLICAVTAARADDAAKIRCLVVTGGHDFERGPFAAMWDALPGIAWREVRHPHAYAEFKPEAAATWDVLVLYDMPQTIPDEAKADLVALLRAGKGVLALHHCSGSYPHWDEYETILGGRYLMAPRTVDGVVQPASTYHEGIDIAVHVVSPDQPVTKGLTDFGYHDEVYGHMQVSPDVTPLLTCATEGSSPTVAWTHRYGRSQIVYIQPGHGPGAWGCPSYRQMLSQAIAWVRTESGHD